MISSGDPREVTENTPPEAIIPGAAMPYSGSIWKATITTCPFLRPRDLKALANLLVSLTTSANVYVFPVTACTNATLSAPPSQKGFRCSPSDPEAMGADHHKFSLQGGTGKLLNTALGISEDTFLLTVVINGNTTGDQDQGNSYSVLTVDGDLTDRDTIRRYTMSVGTERQLTMEFQLSRGEECERSCFSSSCWGFF
ncbi:hypothetical protein OIU84_003655 [Salix udensis]|uniref:Uncharacterized protein n=1 Tax=Salix udensis TaxID=889485 RepID=A0AAD6K0R4_9ROSI|nr:hypothetical protein OIU84_003655 [Salix udensis]